MTMIEASPEVEEIPESDEEAEQVENNRWQQVIEIEEEFNTPSKINDEYKRRFVALQEKHGLHWLPMNISQPLGDWYRNQFTWLVENRNKAEAQEKKAKEIAEKPYEIVCDTCNEVFQKRPTRGRPPKTCYTCKPR